MLPYKYMENFVKLLFISLGVSLLGYLIRTSKLFRLNARHNFVCHLNSITIMNLIAFIFYLNYNTCKIIIIVKLFKYWLNKFLDQLWQRAAHRVAAAPAYIPRIMSANVSVFLEFLHNNTHTVNCYHVACKHHFLN